MFAHLMPATSRTTPLDQLAEINARLARPDLPAVTAAELGVAERALVTSRTRAAAEHAHRSTLPAWAVLRLVDAVGPTEYPYVYGHFVAASWPQGDLVVELSEAVLTRLSHRLDLAHRWSGC